VDRCSRRHFHIRDLENGEFVMSNKTVEQINAEHKAVMTSDSNALDHGIEAGKLLTVMFDKVTAEKKKWSEWLAENCPAISGRTDRDYRTIAKHEPAIRQWATANGSMLPLASGGRCG
jgi:hypothetical protein